MPLKLKIKRKKTDPSMDKALGDTNGTSVNVQPPKLTLNRIEPIGDTIGIVNSKPTKSKLNNIEAIGDIGNQPKPSNIQKKMKMKIKIKKKVSKDTVIDTLTGLQENIGSSVKSTVSFNRLFERCNNPSIKDESNSDRIDIKNWVLNDRRIFPEFLNTFSQNVTDVPRKPMKSWAIDDWENISPLDHQKFVSDYLSDNSPYRGLLLYHGLGSGKSASSIMIAEGGVDKQVVVLLPASLRKNYEDEIHKFGDMSYRKEQHWCFIKITLEEDDTKNNYIYERFKEVGVPKNLVYRILKSKKTANGVWMIDTSIDDKTGKQKASNYDNFNVEQRQYIDEQIKLIYDYKYTFIHYNMGSTLVTHILSTFYTPHEYATIKKNIWPEYPDGKPDREINSLNNIADKYELLNYIYNPENNLPNPFSNKVIIVDEIHNLTSMMAGSGIYGKVLYEMILRAENSKIVFLSGTPVINYAYELALLFNMLRGYIKSYTMALINNSGDAWNGDEIEEILKQSNLVNRITVNRRSSTVEFTRNPYGFVSTSLDKKSVIKSDLNTMSDNDFLSTIGSLLLEKGNYILQGSVDTEYYTIFPDMLNTSTTRHTYLDNSVKNREESEQAFKDQYIDYDNYNIKPESQTLFKKKIVGLVSFYNEISKVTEDGSNYFPDIIWAEEDKIKVPMSDYQFSIYCKARDIERDLEKAQKKGYSQSSEKKNESESGKSLNLFRVFSRQAGLFVFPPGVHRPKPKEFRNRDNAAQLEKSQHGLPITRNELIMMLRNICNPKEHGQKDILINKFVSDMIEDVDKKKVWDQELSVEIDIPIEKASIEDKVSYVSDYICSHNEDFYNDSEDGPEITESDLTYGKAVEQSISRLNNTHLTVNVEPFNLSILSPKYAQILNNINDTPGSVFCYCQYRNVEGIELFKSVLNMNGYSELKINDTNIGEKVVRNDNININTKVRYLTNPDDKDSIWKTGTINSIISNPDGTLKYTLYENDSEYERKDVYKCHYALWTGTESVEQRNEAKLIFNSMDNMYGQQCLILLTTSSGSEGISLSNVRQVHIFEPYWNNVRIDQVIGRARRIKSHIKLPKNQQNVTVYKYKVEFTQQQLNGNWGLNPEDLQDIDRANLPSNIAELLDNDEIPRDELISQFGRIKEELSTVIVSEDKAKTSDEVLADISINKSTILEEFLRLMKEAAIDCHFNRNDNIKSNPSLEADVTCFDIIPESERDAVYNYDLSKNFDYEQGISESHLSKEVTEIKYENKFNLKNGSYFKYIYFLPSNFDSTIKQGVEEYMDLHDLDRFPVYNYYTYYNIDVKGEHELYVKRAPIGYINKNENGGLRVDILNDHNDISRWSNIQKIIEEHSDKAICSMNSSELAAWTDKIKAEYKSVYNPVTKWKCLLCNPYRSLDEDTLVCPVHEGFTKEMYYNIMEQKSSVSTKKSTDTKSLSGKPVKNRIGKR